MIRFILIFICAMIIYSAVRTVFRAARRAYYDEKPRDRIMGDDMVLDPECRTYVVKGRAIVRRVGGIQIYFCSEACARNHLEKNTN